MKRKISNLIIQKIQITLRNLMFKLPERSLLVLICILIGIFAGISAFVLKNLLQYVHNFIGIFNNRGLSVIFLVTFPAVGLFLTVLYIKILHKGTLKISNRGQ